MFKSITFYAFLALALIVGAEGLLLRNAYKTNGVQAAQIAQSKKDLDAETLRANKEARTARLWKQRVEAKVEEERKAREEMAVRMAREEESKRAAQAAEDKLRHYIGSVANEKNNAGNQLVPGPVIERLWAGTGEARSGNPAAAASRGKAIPSRRSRR